MIEPDYFARRRQELGFERMDTLTMVQRWLDEHYAAQARAKSFNNNVLRLATANASVASDLRLRQMEILALEGLAEARLAISIQSL